MYFACFLSFLFVRISCLIVGSHAERAMCDAIRGLSSEIMSLTTDYSGLPAGFMSPPPLCVSSHALRTKRTYLQCFCALFFFLASVGYVLFRERSQKKPLISCVLLPPSPVAVYVFVFLFLFFFARHLSVHSSHTGSILTACLQVCFLVSYLFSILFSLVCFCLVVLCD